MSKINIPPRSSSSNKSNQQKNISLNHNFFQNIETQFYQQHTYELQKYQKQMISKNFKQITQNKCQLFQIKLEAFKYVIKAYEKQRSERSDYLLTFSFIFSVCEGYCACNSVEIALKKNLYRDVSTYYEQFKVAKLTSCTKNKSKIKREITSFESASTDFKSSSQRKETSTRKYCYGNLQKNMTKPKSFSQHRLQQKIQLKSCYSLTPSFSIVEELKSQGKQLSRSNSKISFESKTLKEHAQKQIQEKEENKSQLSRIAKLIQDCEGDMKKNSSKLRDLEQKVTNLQELNSSRNSSLVESQISFSPRTPKRLPPRQPLKQRNDYLENIPLCESKIIKIVL